MSTIVKVGGVLFFLVVLTLSTIFQPASAQSTIGNLQCYTCQSNSSGTCGENMNLTNPLLPVNCTQNGFPLYPTGICFKNVETSKATGLTIYTRGCARNMMPQTSKCDSGDNGSICNYACTGNLCNKGTSNQRAVALSTATIPTAMIVVIKLINYNII